MNYRSFKKDFRMTAKEYERFDRVRRAQGCGFRPWSEFIRDALVKYVEEVESKNPGRFPPAVTPQAIFDRHREAIRETPTPLPAVPCPTPSLPSDKRPAREKKKPAARRGRSSATPS